VKVGIFDTDGILRGKYMSRDKFLSSLKDGFAFCDVVLGWDSNDQLYDSAKYTGWHTAYPDANVRILPETARALPMENNTLLFLGEFTDEAEKICPRGTLRRVLDRAASMGLHAKAACEFEFFVFDETPHSVREKNYKNLKNITPGFFGYSVLRASLESDFHEDLLELCDEMRFPLEGLHTETGPGVLEGALIYDDALEAADRAALFKTYTKVLAQRQDRMATFMAKWSVDYPGQSGHIHISLEDTKTGKNIFYDEKSDHQISDKMRWFIGGQQKLMPELLSMILVQGFGALKIRSNLMRPYLAMPTNSISQQILHFQQRSMKPLIVWKIPKQLMNYSVQNLLNITRNLANGKNANSAKPLPIGKCSVTSKLFNFKNKPQG